MFPLPSARTCETRLPTEVGIPGIWDTVVLVINGTGTNTLCSTPMRVRGTSLSPRVLHRSLLLHRQAKEARVWVEAEDRAHKLRRKGPRGLSIPSHHKLSQRTSQLYRVRFYYLAYGHEYYSTLVHRIHLSLHRV